MKLQICRNVIVTWEKGMIIKWKNLYQYNKRFKQVIFRSNRRMDTYIGRFEKA